MCLYDWLVLWLRNLLNYWLRWKFGVLNVIFTLVWCQICSSNFYPGCLRLWWRRWNFSKFFISFYFVNFHFFFCFVILLQKKIFKVNSNFWQKLSLCKWHSKVFLPVFSYWSLAELSLFWDEIWDWPLSFLHW